MSILKNVKVIGSGAAGNKAAIQLIEEGIVDSTNVLLINSAIKDIPEKYRDNAICLNDDIKGEGSGKERNRAKQLVHDAIMDNKLDLAKFVDPGTDIVIGIGSNGGGTGSGSIPYIGSYLTTYVDTSDSETIPEEERVTVNYHIIALNGFGNDIREFKNTVDFFKDVDEDFVVEVIDNSKFLSECGGSELQAQRLANDEVCRRVRRLIGMDLIDCEQNIDHTDLYKTVTCPGYMTIETRNLNDIKIKNVDTFNQIITEMIDESKSMDINSASQKRLAVMLNIPKASEPFIDYGFNVIKQRLGTCFEVFSHIQFTEDSGKEPFISFISSGLKMPIEEIKKTYDKYREETAKVNKAEDNFFEQIEQMESSEEDDMFDLSSRKKKKKKDFLSEFGNNTKPVNVVIKKSYDV